MGLIIRAVVSAFVSALVLSGCGGSGSGGARHPYLGWSDYRLWQYLTGR